MSSLLDIIAVMITYGGSNAMICHGAGNDSGGFWSIKQGQTVHGSALPNTETDVQTEKQIGRQTATLKVKHDTQVIFDKKILK